MKITINRFNRWRYTQRTAALTALGLVAVAPATGPPAGRKLRRASTRLAAGGAALLVTGTLAATLATAPTASATGKIRCDQSGSATVAVDSIDPIVNHNGQRASHEHQFFGNNSWLSMANPNTANYSDLVGRSTNCRVPQDTAGYWTPTLRYISGAKQGQLVPVQQFTAYYRPAYGQGKDFGPALAFPADARLVSDSQHYNWSCGQHSGARSAPVQSIPDCTGLSGKPGYTLTAHIDMPNCWDGVQPNHSAGETGDTRDNAHYAYASRHVCPAKFPKGITTVRETLQFPYVGDGTDLALDSDAMAGTSDGRSLHADFWNTWDQTFFDKTFLERCVRNQALFTASMCEP